MTAILPCVYLGPVDYYVQLYRHQHCLLEVHDHYQKQSYRNRCVIAGPNGPLPLTIPVVKPDNGKSEMRDIRISDHGNWRHLHWNALVSAYRNSPFFEFYADDFAPFYEKKWEFLVDYNEGLQRLVCNLLDIPVNWERTSHFISSSSEGYSSGNDFREVIHPRQSPTAYVRPYYQVFVEKSGFMPGLSIVDLLFNMGPEGVLYL